MATMKQAASDSWPASGSRCRGASAPQGHGGNVVYKRLRERGYAVFVINLNADQVEGDRCYPDLKSVPGGVEAVVIGTRPAIAEDTMRECAGLGIRQVWMHRGPEGTHTACGYSAWLADGRL